MGVTVADGVACIGFVGGLSAVDIGTGVLRWRQSTGAQVAYYRPQVVDGVVFEWSEDQQLHSDSLCFLWTCDYGGEGDHLHALSAADGSFYWRQPLSAGPLIAVA